MAKENVCKGQLRNRCHTAVVAPVLGFFPAVAPTRRKALRLTSAIDPIREDSFEHTKNVKGIAKKQARMMKEYL